MDIIKEIRQLKCGKVIENANLKNYNTYKVDGTILGVVIPENVEDLKRLLTFLRTNNIKHKIVGNGSNLIFCNNNYDGILIKLDRFNELKIEDTKITVGAGYSLMKLALNVSNLGLTGLEFATGIPGTVGGAIYMNAGAYKSDMGYVVSEVKVLTPNLEIKTLYNRDLDFHYRSSFLQKNPGYICLEATIILQKGNRDIITTIIEDRKKRRLMTQPLEYPSAGSVFRNPENDFAGRLIEEIGYKGKTIGGAKVSEKHANFIINSGGATGSDIKNLILDIKDRVKDRYGIELKVEQEFVE
jgi:UDP-N-acetylmuramate dehydrogenase